MPNYGDTATAPAERLAIGADWLPVVNPATEMVVGHVPDASRQDLDAAVATARAAFPGWANAGLEVRRGVLDAMGDRIFANVDILAHILTSEQGKPLSEAKGEVLGAGYWLKSTASLDLPDEVLEDGPERRIDVRRVPLGVVGAISPWNFPLLLSMFKVGPALLAGNTIVLKPSPFTPLTILKVGELVADLLPPGVLNIVTGGDALGAWLTGHPDIDKISFTGSTETGRKVMTSAADTLKRVTLELGGNDAAIVLADVDVEKIAEELFWSAFRNAGQICIATKRLYVHADIYDAVRDALVAYGRSVAIGDGSAETTQIGPINNRAQYERVLGLIADCRAQGHVIALGGETPTGPGYFVPPTIIDNPPANSRIVQEEQFGPILPLIRFDDVEQVVTSINTSRFGLGTSIWSANDATAREIANRISTGTVWINESQYLSPLVPFGGMRQSGIGLEGGREGLLEYTASQTVVTRKCFREPV